jgi:hypothetical protein
MNDSEIRKQLERIARKYGGSNLLWGAANVLHDPSNEDETGEPSDYGIDAGKHVPIDRAVTLALSMAPRAKLRELIDNGELEFWTSFACELDESPQLLSGPVDIIHVHETAFDSSFRHWVRSHGHSLAEFDTLDEALDYVKRRGLELDQSCDCVSGCRG